MAVREMERNPQQATAASKLIANTFSKKRHDQSVRESCLRSLIVQLQLGN